MKKRSQPYRVETIMMPRQVPKMTETAYKLAWKQYAQALEATLNNFTETGCPSPQIMSYGDRGVTVVLGQNPKALMLQMVHSDEPLELQRLKEKRAQALNTPQLAQLDRRIAVVLTPVMSAPGLPTEEAVEAALNKAVGSAPITAMSALIAAIETDMEAVKLSHDHDDESECIEFQKLELVHRILKKRMEYSLS